MVTSGIPRFVIRPSNKHISAQIIEAKVDGDLVMASAHSSELKDFGWKGSCGNIPAAYLTGLLAGRRAKAGGVSKAILDIGLCARGPGSRIFAAAKGALTAGLTIPHDDSIMPPQERLKGQHVVEYSKRLAAEPETYRKFFSRYLKQKLKPEDLSSHLSEVESKIMAPEAEANK